VATYGYLRRSGARFGCFEVRWRSNELFRSGVRVPMQDMPLKLLRLLLEAEGQVITREEIRSALWPGDTFVDFEHSVNTAVKKLRQALNDSVENPKFVETLPRVGYRFVTSVEWVADGKGPLARVVAIGSTGPIGVHSPAAVKEPPRSRRRWSFAALVLALLSLATIGGLRLRHRPQSQTDDLTIMPFTTFPGVEVGPRFSPDGNQVVFSWYGYEKDFQFDLYVKQVGQERVSQLTHHPAAFLASAWSPDGRFIAFKREADPEGSGVYFIPALGGSERKLARITSSGGPEAMGVAWSSDSKWVAFSEAASPQATPSSPAHYGIHLVNVETYEERTLPAPARECVDTLHPAFSPDGRYLATMCVITAGAFRIHVQGPDGTNARRVTDVKSTGGFADLEWTADSRSLVYAADLRLWRVRLDGGRPEKLLFAQDAESVSIARTGNRLVYAQVRHPGSIWQLELTGPTSAAGPATRLISSSMGEGYARVSPSGASIAFLSRRSGSPEIWVCDRDGSNPVKLTSFGGAEIGPPSWSADSRRIVFDVRAADKPDLYVVNVEGGPPKRFFTGTPNAAYPCWSAGGDSIYFSTEPPGAIWKAPAGGGQAVRLTGEGEGGVAPQEGVDRRRVYYSKVEAGHTEAWSASVNGGDERPVAGMPRDVGWVPASGGIYFVQGGPRNFSVDYLDAATRKIHRISGLTAFFTVWGPTLSPDDRAFLVTGIEHSEGDIVLVDGFR
jgi:Tol biopolymer transport system component/DNA-binding winged helix-turn-helix (wHTH) protein